jgi:acyl-CoA synthetase (AMP-forming)/AMP-acid ligase II
VFEFSLPANGEIMIDFQWMLKKFEEYKSLPCTIHNDRTTTYGDLINKINDYLAYLHSNHIKAGECVAIAGEYSEDLISLFFALTINKNIIIPLAGGQKENYEKSLKIGEASYFIQVFDDNKRTLSRVENQSNHPLLQEIRSEGEAGLILFSSGTTGEPKAAVQGISKLIEKYKQPATRSFRTLIFLKIDHIGGINTLFSILLTGGTIVTASSRSADDVCKAIEKYEVNLLPTTPTFLNLLIMSQAYKKYNLDSLKLITYGTEPMVQSTLNLVNTLFPQVKIKQTFGLTELGIFSTKSKDSNSTWMKIHPNDMQIRIVDNMLHVKASSAMKGYLNAPSPFDENGWLNTGDMVEVDGEYMKILGRKSDLINVGGEKVYPSEVENLVLTIDCVKDVVIQGKSNPITGQIVQAIVVLVDGADEQEAKEKINAVCRNQLESYKVPRLITFVKDDLHSDRFKRMRNIAHIAA